jgi:UDP-N-acetylmuramoyl-tripeptide--D-alanyl-D-alanine ligase
METLAICFAIVGYSCFSYKRLLRYLHIFQQESYNECRFLSWLIGTRSIDRYVSLSLYFLIIGLTLSDRLSVQTVIESVVAIVFLVFAFFELDPRKEAKKKLIMTKRARRIYGVAFVCCIATGLLIIYFRLTIAWILAVQAIPLLLVIANIALMPVEYSIQQRIMRKATSRLAQIHPKTIGITGSFGKTSVKHILGHVLEMNAPTLFTQGSVNTLMGISRVICEDLRANCEYFIVEMGAYGKHSIEKLCRLTPPHFGIITAIGEAHYERFKSLDAVARAKFELAEAVITHDNSVMVVHESVLTQDYARHFIEKYSKQFLVCGLGSTADVKIEKIEQSTIGLTVQVDWRHQKYSLFAPLFGSNHASNVVLAFAAAVTLNISPDRVIAALRSTPQIQHRLEVKPQQNGSIIIDDAFNSNPSGFLVALELLSQLSANNRGRRILVTPGVVELGKKHDEVHKMLGEASAGHADIVFVVRGDRISTFVEAYKLNSKQGVLHSVASFSQAEAWLTANTQVNDIILLENDLPDIIETKMVV